MDQKIFKTLCGLSIGDKITVGFNGESGGVSTVIEGIHISVPDCSCDDYITIRRANDGRSLRKISIFNVWHIAKTKNEAT